MKGLRLTELYPSIQGEGPRTGQPTTFVRFGGCNMRCPGWPCDTQHAIQPGIWKDDPLVSPMDLYELICDMPGDNVCITGGEPTMQPAEPLDVLAGLIMKSRTIDVFTNGSLIKFPPWMVNNDDVSVVLDWKLRGSGEWQRGVETRVENVKYLQDKDVLKFVVASDQDYEEAVSLWKALNVKAQVWCGVAWQHYEESKLIQRILTDNLPWRVNVQIHKYIWPGQEKGI